MRMASQQIERQSRLLKLIRSQRRGRLLLMGRSGRGKTQLLHSMYLDEVESCACSTTLAIADTREVVSDLRDFEFNQARILPAIPSPSLSLFKAPVKLILIFVISGPVGNCMAPFLGNQEREQH